MRLGQLRWAGRRGRAPQVPLQVDPGERLLAWAATQQGVVGGTRDAVYLPEGDGVVRIPWQDVQAADWDEDSAVLRVSRVGHREGGEPEYQLDVEQPGRFLELVRERVTASVVLQRHVPIDGRLGLRVIARRAPGGDRPVQWVVEYDDGIDPALPQVRSAADLALREARQELGQD